MILVFCQQSTPRIVYTLSYVLKTVCGFDYEITSIESDYCAYVGPTLNYSNKPLKQTDIQIKPNGLLHLQAITACEGFIKQEGNIKQLFLKGAGLDEKCFDLFAASFYLLTRYEEYLNYIPDMYDRFEANVSLLFKYRLLDRPLINEWAETIKQAILKFHPETPYSQNQFSCKVTIDVDQVYAFRNRGLLRNVLSLLRNITQFNGPFLRSQWQTLLFKRKDPYDTFDYLKRVYDSNALPFIYFINIGGYSKYDKNLSFSNPHLKRILTTLKSYATIGLHPSYYSNTSPQKFDEEKKALENLIEQPVRQSRQHYLKLQFPQTYRHLLSIGISEDYSMGYASHPGFRAGTCTPFLWFDLEQNKATTLTIFPVVYMENTFTEDLHMQPEEALRYMKKLTDTVRLHDGSHVSIWHNSSLNDQLLWKGWKIVFEKSLLHICREIH